MRINIYRANGKSSKKCGRLFGMGVLGVCDSGSLLVIRLIRADRNQLAIAIVFMGES